MRAVLLLLVSVVASVAVAEEIALKDWIVAPAVPTAPCVCNGVGPVPSNTTPCFCYNGVYEYTAPNTLLGSFLSPTSHNPPVIDFDPSYSENVNNISNTPFWKVPWWFNTTTTVPPSAFALLVFHGINYRADVLVNEHTIVTSDDLVGTFRRFAYDISKYATGSPINIAVRVYGPVDHSFANSTDLAITFVDWNPEPADRTMGIIDKTFIVTRDVPIDATGLSADTVLTDDTFQTSLSFVLTTYASTASLAGAQLRLRLSCVDHALVIPFPASKNAFETRFFFNASDFKELRGLPKKLLWNPWQLGEPTMHALSLEIVDEASQATLALVDFERIGFRQVTVHLDRFGSRQFVVNGLPFLIRGGGWSPDMFYRANDTLLQQQFNLVRDMRLNAIRLEGKFMWDGFFSLADRMGLLVMPGWCCCDSWQHWDEWGPEQFLVSRESLRSQLRRLAHHPSVMMFFYSSDELPPAAVERNYLAVFAEEYWPNPTVSSASATPSNITGPSGVKMSGPYAWVPPAYWLLDSNESFADRGGAWGFLTEGGPGAAPLTLSSWNATVPSTDLWSPEGLMGDAFSFHCASPKGWFRNLRYFAPALDARYGKSDNVVAALYRSQVQTYEGMRAMFEGYTKNKHQGATGVIQWMMNNAWPSHMWHLFDFYLSAAGGSYYGAKKACEEVHAMYSYADRTISVINSLFQDVPFSEQDPLTITVTIRGIGGDVHWARNETVVYPLAGDAVLTFWAVPEVDMEFYFVRVTWESQRVPLGVNDYWLGQQMDVLNWTDSHWYITHVSQYANFSGLSGLQPASIAVVNLAWGVDPRGGLNVSFAVENNLSGVAFAVSVTPVRDGDVDVNPAMMSDSYITLLGFETRRINGWLPWATAADIPHLSIKIQSYNNQVLHQ